MLQDFPVPPNMIEMSVCVDNAGDAQPKSGNCSDNFVGVPAGIDHHSFSGFRATENKAVNPQRSDYHGFENHNNLFKCLARGKGHKAKGNKPSLHSLPFAFCLVFACL
jgi:hypothetical protein